MAQGTLDFREAENRYDDLRQKLSLCNYIEETLKT